MKLERAAYILAMRLLRSDIDLTAEEQEAVNLAWETYQLAGRPGRQST